MKIKCAMMERYMYIELLCIWFLPVYLNPNEYHVILVGDGGPLF